MCTHLSKEPLARYLPSGLKATLYTGSWCFVRVWMQIPRSTSHNLTVESKDALTREKKKDFISNEILSAPPPIYNIQPFLIASHEFLMRSRRCCWEESVLETKLIGDMTASLRASPSL